MVGHANRQLGALEVLKSSQVLAAHLEDLLFARFDRPPTDAELEAFADAIGRSHITVTPNLGKACALLSALAGADRLWADRPHARRPHRVPHHRQGREAHRRLGSPLRPQRHLRGPQAGLIPTRKSLAGGRDRVNSFPRPMRVFFVHIRDPQFYALPAATRARNGNIRVMGFPPIGIMRSRPCSNVPATSASCSTRPIRTRRMP